MKRVVRNEPASRCLFHLLLIQQSRITAYKITWGIFGLIVLSLLFVCLFVCFAVVSSEYNRIIIFKEPIKGKALQGHVIRSVKVANERSCRVQCFMEPNCVSINVGPVQEGKGICELNATDDSPSQSALKNVAQYIHYAVEVRCMSFPVS